jgi:hypothetical protein
MEGETPGIAGQPPERPAISAEVVSCRESILKDWRRILSSDKPFFLGRLGGSDWDLVAYYMAHIHGRPRISIDADRQTRFLTMRAMQLNGYYDETRASDRDKNLAKFCEVYLDCLRNCDRVLLANVDLQHDRLDRRD